MRETGAVRPPGITVIVASALVSAMLATRMVSSARPSALDVPSAQYHEVDSASFDGTAGSAAEPPAGIALAWLDDSRLSSTIAATMTATSATRIGTRWIFFAARRRSHPLPPERFVVGCVDEQVAPGTPFARLARLAWR